MCFSRPFFSVCLFLFFPFEKTRRVSFVFKFIGLFDKIASFREGGELCESACRTSALAILVELGGTPASVNLLFSSDMLSYALITWD